jgi:hypothetical protein
MSSIIASPRRTRLRHGRRAAVALAASALAAGIVSAPAGAAPSTAPDASAHYGFQTVENPQDVTFNQLLGINDSDTIAGYFGSGKKGHPNKGYTLHVNFHSENFPRSAQTQVTGLNNSQATVGFLADAAGDNFGFYTVHGQFHMADYPTRNLAKPSMDQLLGINDAGTAVGFYADHKKVNHGYEYDVNTHRYSQVQVPGDSNVTAAAINDLGDIAGFAANTAGNTEGFLRLPSGRVVHLNAPGASMTQAFGVNNGDEVAGTYTVGTNQNAMTFGFVWTPGFGFRTINDPNGIGSTTINGINDRGQVVGFYADSKGNTDGFVGRPQE